MPNPCHHMPPPLLPPPKPKTKPKFGKPNNRIPGRVYDGEPDAWVDQHGNEWWPENIGHGHLINLINWMRRKADKLRIGHHRRMFDKRHNPAVRDRLLAELELSYAEFPIVVFTVYPRLMDEATKRDMIRLLDEERPHPWGKP